MTTTIEHFNNYLKLFVKELTIVLPDYSDILFSYYQPLLISDNCNDDKYVKRFMIKTQEYKELITNKNDDLFSNDIYILKNVNFKDIWVLDVVNNNKDKIWEYIQTLFILGQTIISDSDRVKNLVKNIKGLNQEEGDGEGNVLDSDDKEIIDMISNLSKSKKKIPEIDDDFIDNSVIGNLAKELSGELNLNDMDLNINEGDGVNDIFSNLLSGDNPKKFMDLIQSVGDKIQNKVSSGDLNQGDLISEAGKMMGALGGDNPMFNNLFNQAQNQHQSQNQSKNTAPDDSIRSNKVKDRLKKKLDEKKK